MNFFEHSETLFTLSVGLRYGEIEFLIGLYEGCIFKVPIFENALKLMFRDEEGIYLLIESMFLLSHMSFKRRLINLLACELMYPLLNFIVYTFGFRNLIRNKSYLECTFYLRIIAYKLVVILEILDAYYEMHILTDLT